MGSLKKKNMIVYVVALNEDDARQCFRNKEYHTTLKEAKYELENCVLSKPLKIFVLAISITLKEYKENEK